MRLQNQVALITGGGDGIGRAIARAYAREGARVVISGRRAEKLEETRSQILGEGAAPGPHSDSARRPRSEAEGAAPGSVVTVPGDVSSEPDVRGLVQETLRQFGRIDILVNNAGIIGPTAPVEQVRTEEWDEVQAINLRGPFLTCREVVPLMLKQDRGVIINIASVAGRIGYPTRSPYAASKWGLIGFSRTLALELSTTGVRVNCVCPGAVMGERLATILGNFNRIIQDQANSRLKAALSYVKASKLLPPEEIASVCVFLASSEAAGVSGQEIVVAGVTG
ncbi:MAG: SDR family oxidoreductase [Nitrospirae bacterium]|nr:SDR family oxidoreductase [Nitrospirota bacterium]